MAQQPLCSKGGKHKWEFVKNASVSKVTHGPLGSHGVFSVRGVYRCDCGAVRTGQAKVKAPGADLRDHLSL